MLDTEVCSIQQWKCLYGGIQLRYDNDVVVAPCCASCKREKWDKSGMIKIREVTFRVDFYNSQIKDLVSHERLPGDEWKTLERGDSKLRRTMFQRLREGQSDVKKRVAIEKFYGIKWDIDWNDKPYPA